MDMKFQARILNMFIGTDDKITYYVQWVKMIMEILPTWPDNSNSIENTRHTDTWSIKTRTKQNMYKIDIHLLI